MVAVAHSNFKDREDSFLEIEMELAFNLSVVCCCVHYEACQVETDGESLEKFYGSFLFLCFRHVLDATLPLFTWLLVGGSIDLGPHDRDTKQAAKECQYKP